METQRAWHAESPDEVARHLEVDSARGLSADEASRRLTESGPNALPEPERATWWAVFLRQFVDVLVAILVVAAAVSAAVGHVVDAITILAIVVLNAVLGFVQEWRAERALEALGRMLAPRARVLRDGRLRDIEATDLVPGDVVEVRGGDRVPADLRIEETSDLATDESALTGESAAVPKGAAGVASETPLAEQASMAWMGTVVARGRGRGLVVATGLGTEFGRVAELTGSVDRTSTPLQRRLASLGTRLGLLGLAVSAATALIGWAAGREPLEMFLTGVSLAVAVVPEGLPAVVTITLALGVREMARRRALVRRLRATETLGQSTVICSDKTGTLTRGEMTLTEVWTSEHTYQATGVGYDPSGHWELEGRRMETVPPDLETVLETGWLCNHARVEAEDEGWTLVGEPTEGALVVAAKKAWLPEPVPEPRAVELPFDSDRKRMTIVRRGPEGWTAHVKGAPEVVLERASTLRAGGEDRPLTEEGRQRVLAAQQQMAEGGLRTLALARRRLGSEEPTPGDDLEKDLVFLGLVGIEDPPRPRAREAVALAGAAGIRTLMITGDAPTTAKAIAQRIGLAATRAVTGTEVEAFTDDELDAALREDVVFARATPAHKLRIVTRLQHHGEVVAMTGDGVNDAPALKKADTGIAMGIRGTDVAKGASDIVLTDDDYASIVAAVEEGRREHANIRRFVGYLLSSNAGEVVAILGNILLGGPLILIPVQILWMNLLTDGVAAVALGLEPSGPGVMRRPPIGRAEGIMDRRAWGRTLLLGTWIGGVTLALYYLYLGSGDSRGAAVAQTVAFTAIIVTEKLNVLNFRSSSLPLRALGVFGNPWLLAAVAGNLLLHVAAVYTPFLQDVLHTAPLALADWGIVVAVALPVFLVPELRKTIRWRRDRAA